MRKPFILFLVATLGLLGVAIGLFTSRTGRSTLAGGFSRAFKTAASSKNVRSKAVSADDSNVIRFASNPQPVPPFLVRDLDGNMVSTASWHGKVVLLNFWATWCPPCREEIPILIILADRYKDKLQVVGISVDDAPPEEVKAFAKEAGINYPIVMRTKELMEEYGGIPALPTSFLVNPDGKVVQKHVGLYPPEVYDAEVRALLGLPVGVRIETFEDTGQIFLKNAALATELPDVDFSRLTPDEKKIALKRMNSENCTCGCMLTMAQCRINDTSCATSKELTAKVVKEIIAKRSGHAAAALPTATP